MASKILKFVHPDRVVNQLKSEKPPDSQPEAQAENLKASEGKNKEWASTNEKFYDHINEKLEPEGVIRLITDSNSERIATHGKYNQWEVHWMFCTRKQPLHCSNLLAEAKNHRFFTCKAHNHWRLHKVFLEKNRKVCTLYGK